MSIRKYVREDYTEYVMLHRYTMPHDLYMSLKHHERIPIFFDNMARELLIIDKRLGLDRMKIKQIVYDMTKTFIELLKLQAEESSMSMAEKSRRVQDTLAKKPISAEVAKEYERALKMDKVVVGKDV